MYNDYTRTFLKDCVDEIKVSGTLKKFGQIVQRISKKDYYLSKALLLEDVTFEINDDTYQYDHLWISPNDFEDVSDYNDLLARVYQEKMTITFTGYSAKYNKFDHGYKEEDYKINKISNIEILSSKLKKKKTKTKNKNFKGWKVDRRGRTFINGVKIHRFSLKKKK